MRTAKPGGGCPTAATAPQAEKPATAEHAGEPATDQLSLIHDDEGRLVRIEGGPFGTITYEHAPRRTRIHAQGLTQEWAYDAFGRVCSYTVHTPKGLTQAHLSYNQDSRLDTISVDGASTSYSYDEAGQLLTRTTPEGTTSYTYDPLGRRTREDGPSGRVSYTWDPSNHLTTISRAGRQTQLDYDEAGRPALINGHTITWAPAGRLTRIDDTPITLLPGALAMGETLLPLGARLARSSSPNDPWTVLTHPLDARTGIDANAFIHVNGLHLMGARVYDPATRQFLSTDPLTPAPIAPWTHSPYSYAANNPLAYTDPTGLKPITDADLAAYNQAHTGFGAQAAEWVGNNWEYLAAGAAIVAGVALMCTGIGGATGGIMSSQPKWLTWEYMTNFKWGVYKGSYLDTPDVFFRAGPADSPYGSWYSKDAPLSISQVRNDKALVEYWVNGGEYRDVAMGYTWIHGNGQPAYSGIVAPQNDPVTGIRYPGGTGQIYLPEQQVHSGWHEESWSWRLAP